MPRRTVVRAPSRLHFGLFALASATGRQYGGVGAMVQEPGLQLSIEPASKWQVEGPLADRIQAAAEHWRCFHQLAASPDCRIRLEHVPPQHVGIGVGTQLALSVAAGLSSFCGLPSSAPQELAQSVCRGRRSAIGTYGFAYGGLIVEQGKLCSQAISPLDTRLDLPETWRFLLVRPTAAQGLSGGLESAAIENSRVDPGVTRELISEIREALVPAAAMGDFSTFASSLYRYSRLAGSFYSQQQGGPYNGPVLTSLVQRIRSLGHEGVGQSSWGPTLFVAQPNHRTASQLAEQLRRETTGTTLDVIIAQPDNRGARIEVGRLGLQPGR